jgi:DNA-binding response OmpR family regulator
MAKILVVEDLPPMLRMLVRVLKSHGYETVTAENGVEAISQAENERPDLIVLDMILPLQNGYAVCRILRSHPELHRVPILMVSAWTRTKEGDDPMGPDLHLAKPFHNDDLLEHIDYLLKSRRSEPPPEQNPAAGS